MGNNSQIKEWTVFAVSKNFIYKHFFERKKSIFIVRDINVKDYNTPQHRNGETECYKEDWDRTIAAIRKGKNNVFHTSFGL